MRLFLLLALCLCSVVSGSDTLYCSDFSQGDKVGGIMFGPPLDGYDFRGAFTNRVFGENKANKITVLNKGVSSDNCFLAKENFRIRFRNEDQAKFHYFYEKFTAPIKLENGMFFSGYLNDGGAADVCVKLAPSISTVSLKDGKKISFELRSSGYSARRGMIVQHKPNWFLTNIDIYQAAVNECRKMGADPAKCEITGWALLVNDMKTQSTIDIHVENIRIYRRDTVSARLKSYGSNIALNCPYEYNIKPNAFPAGHNGDPMCGAGDPAKKLTDGKLATRCWFDPATMGWWMDRYVNITIDLGGEKAVDALAFRISSEVNGARVPSVTRVFVSNDKKRYFLVGELNKQQAQQQWHAEKDFGLMDGNPHSWLLLKNLRAKGRYVTLSLQATSLYMDEIAVFTGNLDPAKIDMSGKVAFTTPDITPFYKHARGCVARETATPLIMNMPSWSTRYALFVDVPDTLQLLAPAAKYVGEVEFDGLEYKRFRVDYAGELYFGTRLPVGATTQIRLHGIHDGAGRDISHITQILPIEIISIPHTKGFKRLVCTVTFADYAFWSRWPDLFKSYKSLGLNYFAPFGHSDYAANLMKKPNPAAYKMIADAKKSGLKIGGNLSPFCNYQINSPLVPGRKAVYLDSGAEAKVNCPRVFLDYMKHPENHDLNAAKAAAAAGLDFMLFDSEPSWNGDICRCHVCETEWRKFRAARHLPPQTLQQAYQSKDSADKKQLNEFWDEFFTTLWGTFRREMAKSAGGKSPILGVYDAPDYRFAAEGGTGNHARYTVFEQNNLIDFANPVLYNAELGEFARAFRECRAKVRPGMPIYSWVTAGDTSMSYEAGEDYLRNQLYLLYLNGAQGAIFYSAYGVDAKDYQIIAGVIRTLAPYEDLIADGKLLDGEKFAAVTPQMELNGVTLNGKTLFYVADFSGKTANATVRLHGKPRRIIPVSTNAATAKINGDTLHINFSGTEKDMVQLFLAE